MSEGMVHQSRWISSPTVKGSDIRVEKRKIHFIKVHTLYLLISGLNMPRYSAKLRPLTMSSSIP